MKDKLLIDAIAYALSREVVPSTDYYDKMQGIQRRQAVSIAGMAQTEQIKFVMAQVNSALASGQTFEQFQKSVNLVDIDLPRHRLYTIYHTNIYTAYSHGRWHEQQRNKSNKPYLMYDAMNDSITRPAHAALDNTIRHIDDPWWRGRTAPLGYNCFLPNTTISANIVGAMVRSYEGEVTELTTQSGHTFAATSNHPILVDGRWVRMDGVNVGDNILRYSRPVDSSDVNMTSAKIDDKQAVATAENLFQSFLFNAFASGGVATLQFNSDVANGKIDIDIADSCLTFGVDSDVLKGVKKIDFTRGFDGGVLVITPSDSPTSRWSKAVNAMLKQDSTDVSLATTEFFCHSIMSEFGCSVDFNNFSFEFVISSVSSSPSSSTLPLSATIDLFDDLPLDRFRLGLGSHGDTIVNEVASDGRSSDTGLFGYLVDTHSSMVFSDPVVNVRQFNFRGHVYDFQSSESLLASDDIITHNCRCKTKALTKEEAEARGITTDKDLPTTGADSSGFGHTPDQYNERFTTLVNDRVSELMLTYFKQSSTVAKIGGRITGAIDKFLNKTTTKLSVLIAAAKKLLKDKDDE